MRADVNDNAEAQACAHARTHVHVTCAWATPGISLGWRGCTVVILANLFGGDLLRDPQVLSALSWCRQQLRAVSSSGLFSPPVVTVGFR